MRIAPLTGIVLLSLASPPRSRAQAQSGWVSRFVDDLDSTSVVAERIKALGEAPSDESVIRTAADYFRNREDPIDLWVIPRSDTAGERDIELADKAVGHVITDVSGSVAFGDHLPWFDAPPKLATLSRFPHFDYLARAYGTTHDERYAKAMVRDMMDFIEHVPQSKSEEYHVQMAPNSNPWNWVLLQWRVKRWIDALSYLRRSSSTSDSDYLRILLHVWDEVDWLEPRKVLGLHNGTLGNVSSILYASLHYPEARNAAAWRQDATSFLEAFLDLAFYPKEFLVELTVGYSEATLLICLSMYQALPESAAKHRIAEKLEAIVDAHVGIMKPDRSLPRYGDHGVYDIRDRILRRSARLFGRDDLERLADSPDDPEGLDGRLSFPFSSNPYYLSGYYAMRDGWDKNAQYLSMDAGPFGTNHQHGDKLSITLSADGANFVVDPGTSQYTSLEPGPRIDLRPGFLHNVITIDGVDPNAGWDRHYGFDVLENRWVTNPAYDFLEGIYEYRNNLLEILWRRSVVYLKGDYWIVLDVLYGSGEHRIESNLQFMVGNDVSVQTDRIEAMAPNGASLDIVEALGTELQPHVVIGDTTFPGTTFLLQYPTFVDWTLGGRGWVGTFGNATPLDPVRTYPAPALLRSGTVNLPFRSAAILTPSIDKTRRHATLEVLSDTPEAFTLRIKHDLSTMDQFHWRPSPWTNHLKKLPDDSGWWFRAVGGRISRIILMNQDAATVTSAKDSITIVFDDAFEGTIERIDDGWLLTPDTYNAAVPKLVRFEVVSDGVIRTYGLSDSRPLTPGVGQRLVERP